MMGRGNVSQKVGGDEIDEVDEVLMVGELFSIMVDKYIHST